MKPIECYAICSSVEEGIFSSEREITLGENKKRILVDRDCLKLSLDDFVVAKFIVLSIKKGLGRGVPDVHPDNFQSSVTTIPMDSLTYPKRVQDYDGRTYKKIDNQWESIKN